MYVASKAIAKDLVETHRTLTVQNKSLAKRPLIGRNKRILLSNVPLIIPHTEVINKLQTLNVEAASSITFLRAGLYDQQFAHIMSFRRQVHTHFDDVYKLTDSFQLNYGDTNYTIYISAESPKCYHCKNEGYVAKNCPAVSKNGATGTKTVMIPIHFPAAQVMKTPNKHQRK